jgi:hypothetical protein
VDRALLEMGFDADWYLRTYPDVASAGIRPRRHFVRHGRAEGRNPGPWLDSTWYLRAHPDAAGAHEAAFDHFARIGLTEASPPHPDVADHPLWRHVVAAEPAQRRAVFLEALPAISLWLDDGGSSLRHLRVPDDASRWERVLRAVAGAAEVGG